MFPTRFFALRYFVRRFWPRPSSGVVYTLPEIIVSTQVCLEPRRTQSVTEMSHTAVYTGFRYTQTFEG